MTLTQIKIAALKLMFASYADLDASDIEALKLDSNLSPYLYAMNDSIDRCFGRFKTERLTKKKVLVLTGGTVGDFSTAYDLTDIADFYAIDNVVFENTEDGSVNKEPYRVEGDTLYIDNHDEDGIFRLIYYPTIPLVSTLTDTSTVALADDLTQLIPYFIAGELYGEEQPAVAGNYRNIFEQSIASLRMESKSKQLRVKAVYHQ